VARRRARDFIVSSLPRNGINLVKDPHVPSDKKEKPRPRPPIKLDDLIPRDDVKGGTMTVFGSQPPPKTKK
jgi:hypothetical protein